MMIRAEMGSIKKRSAENTGVWVFSAAIRMQPGNHISQCDHEHSTHAEAMVCAKETLMSVVGELAGVSGINMSDGELSTKPWIDQGMIGIPTFFNIMDLHPGKNALTVPMGQE